MATKAVLSKVKLQRGNGETSSETFTTIAEITSISGPKETAAKIDVTSLDSSAREYIAGLKDGGEIEIEYNLVGDDTSQAGLRTDFNAGSKRNYKIDLNDATATLTVSSKLAFAAVPTTLGNSFAVGEALKGSATLTISGDVTFTARAAA